MLYMYVDNVISMLLKVLPLKNMAIFCILKFLLSNLILDAIEIVIGE